jgi:ComF family protein
VTAAASIFAGGLDLVFPPRCAFCGIDLELAARQAAGSGMTAADGGGREVAVGNRLPVCDACRRSLAAPRPRCGRCGEPTGCWEGAGEEHDANPNGAEPDCRRCRRFGPVCDGIVVLGAYADELRGLVLRTKRPPGEPIAAALATLLVSRHRARLADWGIDLVVPVPMHWSRRLLRGTSSADEIARGIAAGLGRPRRRLLRRIRATRMQNQLPVAERRANVQNAFRYRAVFPPGRRAAAGRRLLLVDDVMTTGSTLAACREAALTAGAAAVYAAVVARADRGGDGDDH